MLVQPAGSTTRHDKRDHLLFEQNNGIKIIQKFSLTSFQVLCSGMKAIFREGCRTDGRVQKRATILMKSLNDEIYEVRLKRLHLTTMETDCRGSCGV